MNVLAIDIGGTFIKYGMFYDKKLVIKGKQKSNADQGYDKLVQNFDIVVETVRKNFEVDAIAISTAGVVDVEEGEIIHAGPTIPRYKGFNWKKYIKEKYGLESHVDNDVNCALMGEYSIGTVKGNDEVLMIAVGTGIGGAFLKDRKIYRGSNKCGLEVGYMHIKDGVFEKLASTSALVDIYKLISGKESNGIEIFELAKKNDKDALQAIYKIMDNLCMGIANITYILDPKAIVLGGGIMEQEAFLRPIIEANLKKYMLPLAYDKLQLFFAKAGNMAATYGALYHFYQMGEGK